jgi:hypothetical protein
MLEKNERFYIREISFANNKLIAEADLHKYCEKFLHRGILFLLIGGQLERELLAEFAQIEDIKISQIFSKKIKITLFEKTPWQAFVINKKLILIAKDGTILNKNGKIKGLNNIEKMYIVKGVTEEVFQNQIFAKVLESTSLVTQKIDEYLPNKSFQIIFDKLKITKDKDLVFNLNLLCDDILPIKIGGVTGLDQKIKVLKAVLKDISLFLVEEKNVNVEDLKYIDLRVADKVFLGFK